MASAHSMAAAAAVAAADALAATAAAFAPRNASATDSGKEEYNKDVSAADMRAFLTLMAVYAALGVVGNSLMLAVFVRRLRRAGGGRQQQQGQQYNYFTAALALADLFVCAVVVPYKAVYSMRLIGDDDVCKSMQYAAGVSLTFSVLVLIGIAVERYHAVCCPTRPFTGRHAWTIIGVIAALSLFGSFPNYMTSSVYASVDQRHVGCHFASGTRPGRTYAAVLAALFVATLLVTAVLYGLVFRVIYRRTRARGPLKMAYQPRPSDDSSSGTQGTDSEAKLVLKGKTQRQEATKGSQETEAAAAAVRVTSAPRSRSTSRVVWMLFGVTFVFFISWIPYWLTSLHVIPYTLSLKYLYYVNNCTNFIVYGICNKKIRQEMINRLLCR